MDIGGKTSEKTNALYGFAKDTELVQCASAKMIQKKCQHIPQTRPVTVREAVSGISKKTVVAQKMWRLLKKLQLAKKLKMCGR